jgi:SAM-dependent methyltransferase
LREGFLLSGLLLLVVSINQWNRWISADSTTRTMRLVIPGSAHRDWFSNDTFDLFSQHSQNASTVNAMKDPAKPGFDAYASEYDTALAEGLSVSGETKDFFAEGRVKHLAVRLQEVQFHPGSIMDFGCGTGTNTPFLLNLGGVTSLLGVDVSESSLNIARRAIPDPRSAFSVLDQYRPDGRYDLVFTSGVFHHIPPPERAGAIDYIFRTLRPAACCCSGKTIRGIRCAICDESDSLRPRCHNDQRPRSPELIHAGGFECCAPTSFSFRNCSASSGRAAAVQISFGAQYQLLCRKPVAIICTLSL